ncbi:hypothetical protein [Brevibacillus sp. FSL L8-0710]|uniref:hypothetical protein n=1 Tax=Brevibacillus sp. FSL L8-0710 TaxID=2975313 RepID=UPI0030FCA57C
MWKQFKISLERNNISLSTTLPEVNMYLIKTQNEMTSFDMIQCFGNFDTEIRKLNLSESGRKLIREIIKDPYNPFEFDRAVQELIGKVEYKYGCSIEYMTLQELLYLVVFAHMYLGEATSTSVNPVNEAIKWINFEKTDFFVTRYVEDELYFDGFVFQGKFSRECYDTAKKLLSNGWVEEVRFFENNQLIICYRSQSNDGAYQIEVKKEGNQMVVGNYHESYFSFWTRVNVKHLQIMKHFKNYQEIIEYLQRLPVRVESKPREVRFNSDEELLPF